MKNISFGNMYNNVFNTNERVYDRPEIRASNMPFCPKKFIFSYSEFLSKNYTTWEYTGDFYCDIGTSVHEAVQKWITMPQENSGIIFGNWKCKKCNKKLKLRVGPQICCGTPMEYEELSLDFVDCPMTGHCDGVLLDTKIRDVNKLNKKIKNGSKKSIPAWILELKTTSLYKAKNITAPQFNHASQAEIYTSALRKILTHRFNIDNIDLKGFIIKYISRDNPFVTSKDIEQKVDKEDKLYYYTCELVNDIYRSFANRKYKKLWKRKPCKDMPNLFGECDWEEFCRDATFKDFKTICENVRKDFVKYNSTKVFKLFKSDEKTKKGKKVSKEKR